MLQDQVFLGVFIGALLGFFPSYPWCIWIHDIGHYTGLAFSHLMKSSHQHGFIDRESCVAQYLSLAIFITGIVLTLGSDELLAAFTAGQPFLDLIYSSYSPCFLLKQEARYHGTATLTYTPKEIPAMLVLYTWIPEITSWREALFSGHFGNVFFFFGIWSWRLLSLIHARQGRI